MELFWVDLWLCIWSVWKNVRMEYTSVIILKHFIYSWNFIWMILWVLYLIILVIPRITSQFGWVESIAFVICLMDLYMGGNI